MKNIIYKVNEKDVIIFNEPKEKLDLDKMLVDYLNEKNKEQDSK